MCTGQRPDAVCGRCALPREPCHLRGPTLSGQESLSERVQPCQVPPDHQLLNLGGAIRDRHDFRIAEVAFDGNSLVMPLPPWICTAFPAISTAISVAYHFAIEVWVSQRTPISRSCSPRWHNSRPASRWVAMSARYPGSTDARQSAFRAARGPARI